MKVPAKTEAHIAYCQVLGGIIVFCADLRSKIFLQCFEKQPTVSMRLDASGRLGMRRKWKSNDKESQHRCLIRRTVGLAAPTFQTLFHSKCLLWYSDRKRDACFAETVGWFLRFVFVS